MRRPDRLTPVAAGVLAAATAILGSGAIAALHSAGGVSLGEWRPLALAAGYDRAADTLLKQERPTSADLARAASLSRQAIARNPYDTAAWLRLASIDVLASGKLTPAGVAAVRRSYDLVGFDPYVASWRIQFTLAHWGDIPPDLRREIRAEAMALGGEWKHREKILAILAGVRAPEARLTAAMWASRIQRTNPESITASRKARQPDDPN